MTIPSNFFRNAPALNFRHGDPPMTRPRRDLPAWGLTQWLRLHGAAGLKSGLSGGFGLGLSPGLSAKLSGQDAANVGASGDTISTSSPYYAAVPDWGNPSIEPEPNDPNFDAIVFGSPAMRSAWSRYLSRCQRCRRSNDWSNLAGVLGIGNIDAIDVRSKHSGVTTRRRVSTPLLILDSNADEDATRYAARLMTDVAVAWTQWFFPFWRYAAIASRDKADAPPPTNRIRPMRAVLFGDAEQYRTALDSRLNIAELSRGQYDPDRRISQFYIEGDIELSTRSIVHEWTHQLFAEASTATAKRFQIESEGFWLIEGIAGYMESFRRIGSTTAMVGGWHASRLQFARHRYATQPPQRSDLLLDRASAQSVDDPTAWYAHSILATHALMHRSPANQRSSKGRTEVNDRSDLYRSLASRYRTRGSSATKRLVPGWEQIRDALRVDAGDIRSSPPPSQIRELCLVGTELSDATLASLPRLGQLRWLDLSGLPVSIETLTHLLARPGNLRELSLAGVRLGDELAPLLNAASSLRELDLVLTSVGDPTIGSIAGGRIETLYLTATNVTDDVVPELIAMAKLRRLDVQRSGITTDGIARIGQLRPDIELNPLRVVS